MLRRAVAALSSSGSPAVATAFEDVLVLSCYRSHDCHRAGTTSACSAGPDTSDATREHRCSVPTLTNRFSFPGRSLSHRHFSSHAGANSGDQESDTDVDDGFSELEVAPESDKTKEVTSHKCADDLGGGVSESESDGEELDLPDAGVDSGKKNDTVATLLKPILDAPSHSIGGVLDKLVKDGCTMGRSEMSAVMLILRRRKIYHKALKLSEWLQKHKHFEFVERDYATRVDLIAKVHGPNMAEKHIARIPEAFRSELIYRTLLASCVAASNLFKTEEVFNKMRSMGFPLTVFVCNQLLLLYKRCNRKKIADVLLLMENENIKPADFTYRILIDVKGSSNDIDGMEEVVKSMKAEGLEPSMDVQSAIARHYIYGGCKDKAEAVLKEIEGINIRENRYACEVLLPLYAALGKKDEVERLWEICDPKPRFRECIAAIEAWGKLGHVESAEAVFERMRSIWSTSAICYKAMLEVYADHNLLNKGEELVRQMSVSGLKIGPAIWDALVKVYLSANEVEKADSLLAKAASQSRINPMYSSYLSVLEKYAKRGDIHNSEKIFQSLRTSGYTGTLRMYQLLLKAYIVAKSPAYGFMERMKADNIFPSPIILGQLKTAEAFKKREITELIN